MMTDVTLLAILQGIAEFLPISSSGHLVLGRQLLGLGEMGLRLDVFLHVGTLLSIAVFYWKIVWRVLAGREWSYMAKIVLSAVPAGVVGLLFKDELEAAFQSPAMVGFALVFTGLVLTATRFLPRGTKDVSFGRALLMGLAQAVAIIPGVSRSGMTLAAARGARTDAVRSAEFSFLMSAPPIAGAALLELKDGLGAAAGAAANEVPWGLVVYGGVLAAVVGYFALAVLLKALKSDRFWLFGPYCLAAGALTVGFARATDADDWRLVAVDQATTSAIVYDAAPEGPARELWRWTPARDPKVRPADVASFGAIDECKVVDGGATVFVNASLGGVAAIDVATTQVVWYAKASRGCAGPHSVCRLPDGRIAVANSVGCDALEIIDVRSAPLDPARQTVVRAADVPGAHGVDWNAARNSLFVLGYTNLHEYAYAPETASVRELHRWNYSVAAADPDGHDLVPDGADGYFFTNSTGVWRIDVATGKIAPVRMMRHAKSFSRDPRKGDLLMVARVSYWADRLLVVAPDGTERTVGPFPGARFYKARWFAPEAAAR